jgi:hypothetical protein
MEANVSERLTETELTAAEVGELCGDVLDWKIAAILELRPSRGDIAAAAAWAAGEDDLDRAGRPLEGAAAQVYDVLCADDYGEEC